MKKPAFRHAFLAALPSGVAWRYVNFALAKLTWGVQRGIFPSGLNGLLSPY